VKSVFSVKAPKKEQCIYLLVSSPLPPQPEEAVDADEDDLKSNSTHKVRLWKGVGAGIRLRMSQLNPKPNPTPNLNPKPNPNSNPNLNPNPSSDGASGACEVRRRFTLVPVSHRSQSTALDRRPVVLEHSGPCSMLLTRKRIWVQLRRYSQHGVGATRKTSMHMHA
jgi:hypothetical protein